MLSKYKGSLNNSVAASFVYNIASRYVQNYRENVCNTNIKSFITLVPEDLDEIACCLDRFIANQTIENLSHLKKTIQWQPVLCSTLPLDMYPLWFLMSEIIPSVILSLVLTATR